MKDPVQHYEKGGLTVTFDPRVCTHSGVCVQGLYDVFDVSKRPWVNLDGAPAEQVVEQVKRCPSGALHFGLEAKKG
ncbi:MAG: (4Fe-4S)-binding protein [Acidobacteria bacterium]|nr:(4Fe-4S)-binding protein [Acidobacteriota bacterium]